MSKQKIIVMQGLPGSGKSTRAKEIFYEHEKDTIVRVCKDQLRWMVHFNNWNEEYEKLIELAELKVAEAFLELGYSLIIDDTNLRAESMKKWVNMSERFNCKLEVVRLKTSIEECIARDKNRKIVVGEKVIREMAEYELY